MYVYSFFRWCYRALDYYVFRHLSPQSQQALKAALLSIGRRLYPDRVIEVDSRHLIKGGSSPMNWMPPPLPEWARAEMEEIASQIDPLLDPQGDYGRQMEFYGIPTNYDWPGLAYAQLRNAVVGQPDVVLLVPWLKRGGADLGAIYFARALHDAGRSVLVIATEVEDSPWSRRLPDGVQFLDAGQHLAGLSDSERVTAMTRLLVQLKPDLVHIMNSRLAWDVVRKHGLAVRQESRIFASLYCDDRSEMGHPVGYAQFYLVDCYMHLTGVITDNSRNYKDWCAQFGVPASLFQLVGFPARTPVRTEEHASEVKRNRLLWAGRMDRQKRPDLIAQIAKALPEFEFDVFGASVVAGQGVDIAELKALPNVHLNGAFEDFFDLVQPEHLALVYTSAWDGLPTILLDAAAVGLPVVAPNLGGIPDFLSSDQMIESAGSVEAYATWIRNLAANPDLWQQHRERGLEKAAAERSWAAFVAAVEGVNGYLAVADGQPVALAAQTPVPLVVRT